MLHNFIWAICGTILPELGLQLYLHYLAELGAEPQGARPHSPRGGCRGGGQVNTISIQP